MQVLNVEFGWEYDETAKAWDRVIVTVRGKNSEKTGISVELFHGKYRPDLGALITTALGEILEREDLDDYDTELKEILRTAEDYSASAYRMESTGIAENYVLKVFREKVVLTEVKYNATTCQKEFKDIKSFEPVKKAKEFLEGILKGEQGVLKC